MAVYAVNFETMLDQLADNLEIERPDSYHTDISLKRFINLGIIEMAKKTKVVHIVKFMYLSANVARYSAPSSGWLYAKSRQMLYLRNGSLSGSQYALQKVSREQMQLLMPHADTSILSAAAYNKPAVGNPLYYLLDGDTIEFMPIPSTAAAGTKRICFKFPGIPDALSALSAVPNIPVEYRMIPVTYATYYGEKKAKDPEHKATLKLFYAECEATETDTKWGDQEEPPIMHVEPY